ncbi:MAG: hypothetical protein WC971_00165 [Coriobacteriia bacterium]
MEPKPTLAPCFVGTGTLSRLRDMVRALETVESCAFAFAVDGTVMSEGRATLVKLMADDDSATLLLNDCLFLNVRSFRFLDFATAEDGACTFTLMGDGTTLTLTPIEEEAETPPALHRAELRMLEDGAFDPAMFVALDEDDDED